MREKRVRIIDIANDLGAVSYTHLDVYKRQDLQYQVLRMTVLLQIP